jgi:3-deoxy-D-manno-octulosonic-acid transferase
MRFVLDCFYAISIIIASPWLVYSISKAGGWRSVPARFGFGIERVGRDAIWLHGSSVGEVNLLRPMVGMLERDYPDAKLIITSYTNSGLAAARRIYPQLAVLPFPVDFSFVVSRFLRTIDPRAIVIVESEFWPNLLAAAAARKIPVAVVNAKMSKKSLAVHQRTHIVAGRLRQVDLIAAQTQEHAARFTDLGVAQSRIQITGNMKYDLMHDSIDVASRERVRHWLGYDDDQVLVIGASLHLPEDEVVLDSYVALRQRFPCVALTIVPRYPSDGRIIAEHAALRGLRPVLKTALDRGDIELPGTDYVLIVDTLGELGEFYNAADIAFVGGSLHFRGANKGGHNLMEPAILGIPVLFGPYNFSFKETVADLLASEAGVLVRDASELEAALARFLEFPPRQAEFGARARRVILDGQGATARSLAHIAPLLAGSSTVAARVASDDNAPVRH